eukprot:4224201-Lingulodinium_polyedra.AAC.1
MAGSSALAAARAPQQRSVASSRAPQRAHHRLSEDRTLLAWSLVSESLMLWNPCSITAVGGVEKTCDSSCSN